MLEVRRGASGFKLKVFLVCLSHSQLNSQYTEGLWQWAWDFWGNSCYTLTLSSSFSPSRPRV